MVNYRCKTADLKVFFLFILCLRFAFIPIWEKIDGMSFAYTCPKSSEKKIKHLNISITYYIRMERPCLDMTAFNDFTQELGGSRKYP